MAVAGGGGDAGGRRFRRKSSTLMSEINITPFVDVMLVLLVIFMVTAPLLQSGIAIDLPKEDVGALDIREENIISVESANRIYFNDRRVTEKELADKLKNIVAASPTAEVYLRADRKIPYGYVMRITGIAKKSGVDKLGMVTEMPEEQERKR
ncbi:MAG: ExbD/TolR family protein [Nitrospinae bacterium]|nr:ExbD/TolR family protein [Nitrospinota bacterium]